LLKFILDRLKHRALEFIEQHIYAVVAQGSRIYRATYSIQLLRQKSSSWISWLIVSCTDICLSYMWALLG